MNSRYKQLDISIKKKLSWDFLGSFQTAFKWLWTEFDSLREYIPWDSIKSIDWKSTAKLWDVHVKNYEEEKDLKILFLIDNSTSLDFGSEDVTKKETLEEIFFLLAYSSIATWHSIWSFVNWEFIDFKKWEENILKTLNTLSIPSSNKKSSSLDIKKLNIKNTLILHLTDSLSPDINQLKYLNISNEIIIINIFDYFENNLSEDVFAGFFWKIWTLVLGNKNKTSNYKKIRDWKIQALKKILKKQEIEYLKIDNRDDIFLQFYKFFSSYKH